MLSNTLLVAFKFLFYFIISFFYSLECSAQNKQACMLLSSREMGILAEGSLGESHSVVAL